MTESESTPRVLGVETILRMTGPRRSWSCCFGILFVSITENGGAPERPLCEGRIANKTIALNATREDAVAAIERDLLSIRSAIPEAGK